MALAEQTQEFHVDDEVARSLLYRRVNVPLSALAQKMKSEDGILQLLPLIDLLKTPSEVISERENELVGYIRAQPLQQNSLNCECGCFEAKVYKPDQSVARSFVVLSLGVHVQQVLKKVVGLEV